MQGGLKVTGIREFQRALAKGDKEQRKQISGVFKEVGEIVRERGASLFSGIDAGSAAGFRTVVRQRGVEVEQRKRRVTGKRGDYGALQMRRALVPALEEKQGDVVDAFEDALDKVIDIVEG